MNLIDNLKLMSSCICEPVCDSLHNIFFCCSKKYRCKICNYRFRYKDNLSQHYKKEHKEIFSFGKSYEIKKDDDILYVKNNKIEDESDFIIIDNLV